jgi:aspartyl-tRNA(Asn)/glutamyl-tRNA(Gln) amidotransferase subunit B
LQYLTDSQASIAELPAQKRHRYQSELGLSAYDARVLVDEREVAEYFEAAIASGANAKLLANWITQDIAAYLNNHKLGIQDISLKPDNLAELVILIEKGTISNKIGKDILPELLEKTQSVKELIEKKGLISISDPQAIEKIIDEVILAHPTEVEKYRAGKTSLKGFFIGQVMKKSGGKADPKLTNQLIEQKL